MCFGVTNTCSNHYTTRKNNINIKNYVLHNHSCCPKLVWCITPVNQIVPFLCTISSLLLDNGEQKNNNLTVVRWEAKWKFWLTLRVSPTCFKNVVRADAIAVLQNKEWNIADNMAHYIIKAAAQSPEAPTIYHCATKISNREPYRVPKTYDSQANFQWTNKKIPCSFYTLKRWRKTFNRWP